MEPGGTSSPDTFVVRPDRRAARQLQRTLFASLGVAVVGNVYVLAGAEGGDALLSGALALSFSSRLAWFGLTYGRFQAADALAEISPWGVSVNVLSAGWAALPWEAVGSVRTDYAGRIVVESADGVDPHTPGRQWPDDRRAVKRVRRTGLFIPKRQTDAAPNQVRAAIEHLSGGRFPAVA